jgi:peptidoglycan/xylan/chitin deacetylase (PgdA/CDA1 family)
MNGIFTISLDFELHWGGFEKWPLEKKISGWEGHTNGRTFNQYFLNTRKVILEMLRLFTKYEAHVTWAGVGMLMHKDRVSLENNFPVLQPSYRQEELSAYQFIQYKGIGNGEVDDPYHYADSLVKQIVTTPYQELGSHTFSHYYCNEPGQTIEQFRADLRAAQRAASKYGVTLRSLVFPRNQFNDSYLKICSEEGFLCVRSNPADWFWHIGTRHESTWKRLNRGLDAYFPLGSKNTYPLQAISFRPGFPLCIPASRLLRPYRPQELFLNLFKINRIVSEMEAAARAGEVYHLWWHPHNFGHYPEESLRGLEKILKGFEHCRTKWDMAGMTMSEVAESRLTIHGDEIA